MKRLILSLFILTTFAFATTINVPTDYSTIQAGINAASNGDTVLVAVGTYVENINFNGKSIALIGDSRESTIIDGNQSGSVITIENYETPEIKGFTSNPSLMSKSGITNYDEFITKFLSLSNGKPVSFEVVSDDFENMEREALKINSYADNIYVKIPITNSKGEYSIELIKKLLKQNLKINITAVLANSQIEKIINNLDSDDDIILSYFAGRVADTGIDPVPVMVDLKKSINDKGLLKTKILWASPREVFNVYQANIIGVDIITVTKSLIDKLTLKNKNLEQYSLETVQMFLNDAIKNNLKI